MRTKVLFSFVGLVIVFSSIVMAYETNNYKKVDEARMTISSGHASSFVIKSDNSLWGWGDNSFGQLGDGTVIERHIPVKIMDDVSMVSAGIYYTMAVRTDGSLWAWGRNVSGQLGDGTTIERHVPVKIMEDVLTVSARAGMAIRTDGSLWVWGYNLRQWLEDGSEVDDDALYLSPIKIMEDVLSVSAGVFHTMIIKTDGSLWAWGSTRWGLLGDGTVTEQHTSAVNPVRIMYDVVAVSVGDTHTAALRADGSLWAWGRNDWGQLGDGTTTVRHTPVRIIDDVIAVSAGLDCTMAIRTDGSLWSWGENASGQLGDGTTANRHIPTRIMDDVVAVSTGGSFAAGPGSATAHTIAVRVDGSLWAWGSNSSGQLGNGTTTERGQGITRPIKVLANVMLPGDRTPQLIPTTQTQLRFVIGQTQFTHNNTPHTADVAPFIDPVYNRTMVPLRIIAEAFGAEARWNSATRTAHITGAGVNLSLNADTPLPGGMGIPMNVNGNIFVPLAHVAQQFGATTRWDRDTRAVYVMQ